MNLFKQLLGISFLLLICFEGLAQFRNYTNGPEEGLYTPDLNARYQKALHILMYVNEREQWKQNDSSRFAELVGMIQQVGSVEGNYAGELTLLEGKPGADMKLPDNTPFFNCQEIISHFTKTPVALFWQAKLFELLSDIFEQTGNPEKSLLYQNKSLKILEGMQDKHQLDYLQAMVHLARMELAAGNNERSLGLVEKIQIRPIDNGGSVLYLRVKQLKALLAEKQNDLLGAVRIYEKSFAGIKLTSANWDLYYEARLQLGRLYLQLGRYGAADTLFLRGIATLRKHLCQSVAYERFYAGYCESQLYQKQYPQSWNALVALSHLILFQTYRNGAGMSEDDLIHFAARLDDILNLMYSIMVENTNEKMFDMLFVSLQRKSLVYLNRQELLKQTKVYWNTDLPMPYRPLKRNRRLIDSLYAVSVKERKWDADSLTEVANNYERQIANIGFYTSPDDSRRREVMVGMRDDDPNSASEHIEFVQFKYKTPVNNSGQNRYAAFVFENSFNRAHFVNLCSESALLNLMSKVNNSSLNSNSFGTDVYSANSAASAQLYRFVWQPLTPYLQQAGKIYFSPAGLINNISMDAIYNGKNFLMKEYNLQRVLSFLELTNPREPFTKPGFVRVWGNIDYDSVYYTNDSIPLRKIQSVDKPACNQEVQALGTAETDSLIAACKASKIPFSLCQSTMATEEAFRQSFAFPEEKAFYGREMDSIITMVAEGNDPPADTTAPDTSADSPFGGVLHISTHTFYMPYDKKWLRDSVPCAYSAATPNPLLRTGLALAGFKLYWYSGQTQKNYEHPVFSTIQKMLGAFKPERHDNGFLDAYEVQQLNLKSIRLVVLSGCETGLGDLSRNEGILGLQRSFKMAGAQYLLVSLWQINPQETARLMSLFYKNWFAGASLSNSLHMAQQTLQKDGSPPFVWASFVLIE